MGDGKLQQKMGDDLFTTPSSPNKGAPILPATYRAGNAGYMVWLGLIPAIVVLAVGPAKLEKPQWLVLSIATYSLFAVLVTLYFRRLKIEIRTDGMSYSNLFRGTNVIAYSEILSAVHYFDSEPNPNRWNSLSLGRARLLNRLVIIPRSESGKPTVNIPLKYFPDDGQEHVKQVLRPQELDLRD
jgi:hypothetical protein